MIRLLIDKINLIKNSNGVKQYSFPIFIFLILASFSFGAYHYELVRETASLKNMMTRDAAGISYSLEIQLKERLSALQRMAARWSAANGTPKKIWEIDAKNYIGTLLGLKTLEWIDSTYHVRWIMPFQENDINKWFDIRHAVTDEETIKRNALIVTPPFILPQGYAGFLSLYPVKAHGLFDGFLVGIFDIKKFFTEALSYYSHQDYILSLSYKGIPYFSNNTQQIRKPEWIIHTKLMLFDKQWELNVEPGQKMIGLHRTLFPITLLIAGLLFSLLVALTITSLLGSRSRTHDLAKANYLINTILQSTKHLIIATDNKGMITSFNKSSERALGYRAEEIVGKKTPIIWHDFQEVIARAEVLTKELGTPITPGFEVFITKAKRGITETVEWTLIRKDGSRFPAKLTPTTLKDNDQIIGYLGVLEDIREQKKSESEIRELKAAMENAIEGVAKLDPSGHYIFVNDAYARMVGYKPDELIGKQWTMTVHPADQPFMISEYNRMLEVGKVSPEARGVRKDGSSFYKQLTMIPNIDEKGKFIGHFCFMKDISEQKENERKNALLASIVESSEDAMISKNLNGIITAWNKGAENLFGYTAEEMIGENITILLPSEKLNEEEMILQSIRKGDSVRQMETIRLRKDGAQVDVSLTISPIFDTRGAIIGASKVVRDITQRKRQEKEMELLTDKLLESNTELERFAYIASHDLQEPIRMITNFSEIIAQDYGNILDDDGKQYLKFVTDAGVRMREMIDDLLSYSRLSNNDERMHTFKGESIICEVQENLKALINDKQVKITHDTLPELYGNPVQVLRLLQNLIVNAIKYQPVGNIPEIHVSAEEKADYWCISVRDNGLGIKPEFIDVIFQPFKRLHTWDSISGTGLGLAICNKIAKNHGGMITVRSEFGKGSVFSFCISKQLKKKGGIK